ISMISLTAKSKVPHYDIKSVPKASQESGKAKKGRRKVFLATEGEGLEIPVYNRSLLTNGHRLTGPGLVESEQTSLLVPAGWQLQVDQYNNMILEEVS
ncbi:MAG: hypothetical protein GY729_18145, partial [Desulfobacteraceae bacterium]|nr:hypothetical protein [Desulfobacteraceae bacterium]